LVPSHRTYPDLSEQAYAGKGKDRPVNSANTPQVPSVACNVWSKFATDPIKNNLSS
jgi:hypothetical protein